MKVKRLLAVILSVIIVANSVMPAFATETSTAIEGEQRILEDDLECENLEEVSVEEPENLENILATDNLEKMGSVGADENDDSAIGSEEIVVEETEDSEKRVDEFESVEVVEDDSDRILEDSIEGEYVEQEEGEVLEEFPNVESEQFTASVETATYAASGQEAKWVHVESKDTVAKVTFSGEKGSFYKFRIKNFSAEELMSTVPIASSGYTFQEYSVTDGEAEAVLYLYLKSNVYYFYAWDESGMPVDFEFDLEITKYKLTPKESFLKELFKLTYPNYAQHYDNYLYYGEDYTFIEVVENLLYYTENKEEYIKKAYQAMYGKAIDTNTLKQWKSYLIDDSEARYDIRGWTELLYLWAEDPAVIERAQQYDFELGEGYDFWYRASDIVAKSASQGIEISFYPSSETRIYRSEKIGSLGTVISTVYDEDSYVDETAQSGKVYYYRIQTREPNYYDNEWSSVSNYARYGIEKYTIALKGNGSTSGKMSNVEATIGQNVTLPYCTYKKTGNTFVGWNTKADGSGIFYSDADVINNLTSIPNGTATLYAQWKPATFKITYLLDGGINSSENLSEYSYGVTQKLYPAEKEGYSFLGWYKDAKFKTKITSISKTSNKDVCLYAKWKPTTYKITYVLEKGIKNSSKNPGSYTIKSSDIKLQDISRKGFKFEGWYLDQGLTQKVSEIKNGSYGNVILYPKWKPNMYFVCYLGNGDENGDTAMTEHFYKTSGQIAECGFTKPGYSFVKWCTKANGKGKLYNAGYDKNDLTTEEGELVVLYAQWKVNSYKVIYNGNGATSGKTENSKLTYGKKEALKKCGFKKTGYEFIGWNTCADGSGTQYSNPTKKQVYNLTEGTENVILYAQWKPINYTICLKGYQLFEFKNIDATYDNALKLPKNTYESPNGKYHFIGWSLKKDRSGRLISDEETILNESTKKNEKITLYATFGYEILFDANGGNGTMSPQSAAYNVQTKLTANSFEKEGYTFNGWKAIVDGKEKSFSNKQSVKNLINADGGEVVLKAQWKPIKYKVQYLPNTGNKKYDSNNKSKKIIAASYDQEITISDNIFKNEGYIFAGWNTKADGSGIAYEGNVSASNLTSQNNETVKLYAQWKLQVRDCPPELTDSYYYGNNGYKGYSMPNCTAYAYGRIYELNGRKPNVSMKNADQWFSYNKKGNYYLYSQDAYAPQLGAVVCYTSSGVGHVQVVEEIGTDESGKYICVSESNYSGRDYPYISFNYKKIYLDDLNSSKTSGKCYLEVLEDNDGYSDAKEKETYYSDTDKGVKMYYSKLTFQGYIYTCPQYNK